MPLPLTISCSSKSRLVWTFLVLPFWYLLTRVDPDVFQTSSKTVVCVCVSYANSAGGRIFITAVVFVLMKKTFLIELQKWWMLDVMICFLCRAMEIFQSQFPLFWVALQDRHPVTVHHCEFLHLCQAIVQMPEVQCSRHHLPTLCCQTLTEDLWVFIIVRIQMFPKIVVLLVDQVHAIFDCMTFV